MFFLVFKIPLDYNININRNCFYTVCSVQLWIFKQLNLRRPALLAPSFHEFFCLMVKNSDNFLQSALVAENRNLLLKEKPKLKSYWFYGYIVGWLVWNWSLVVKENQKYEKIDSWMKVRMKWMQSDKSCLINPGKVDKFPNFCAAFN